MLLNGTIIKNPKRARMIFSKVHFLGVAEVLRNLKNHFSVQDMEFIMGEFIRYFKRRNKFFNPTKFQEEVWKDDA